MGKKLLAGKRLLAGQIPRRFLNYTLLMTRPSGMVSQLIGAVNNSKMELPKQLSTISSCCYHMSKQP